MSLDVEILSESYQALKQYIPQKDRQEASDALMSILENALTYEEAKELAGGQRSPFGYFKRGYIIQMTNPKAALGWILPMTSPPKT